MPIILEDFIRLISLDKIVMTLAELEVDLELCSRKGLSRESSLTLHFMSTAFVSVVVHYWGKGLKQNFVDSKYFQQG